VISTDVAVPTISFNKRGTVKWEELEVGAVKITEEIVVSGADFIEPLHYSRAGAD
jgi:hypothetical protein